jgi:hypothetical protein
LSEIGELKCKAVRWGGRIRVVGAWWKVEVKIKNKKILTFFTYGFDIM